MMVKRSEKKGEEDVKDEGDGWDLEDPDVDEIVEDEVKSAEKKVNGHLSLRMRIPGNMWMEVWAAARPVPARRQKRLFDDTKEAEKVLHYLSNMKPSDIALQLFPTVVQACLSRIASEDDRSTNHAAIENIIKSLSRLHSPSAEDLKSMADISQQVRGVEVDISRTQSLRLKFSNTGKNEENLNDDVEQFIQNLLTKGEVAVA